MSEPNLFPGDKQLRQERLLPQDQELYLLHEPSQLGPAVVFLGQVMGIGSEAAADMWTANLKDLHQAQSIFKSDSGPENNLEFANAADLMLGSEGQIALVGHRLVAWYAMASSLVVGAHEGDLTPPCYPWKADLDRYAEDLGSFAKGPIEPKVYNRAVESAGGEGAVRQSAMNLWDECGIQAIALSVVEALIYIRLELLRSPESSPEVLVAMENTWAETSSVFCGNLSTVQKSEELVALLSSITRRYQDDNGVLPAIFHFSHEWTSMRRPAFSLVVEALTQANRNSKRSAKGQPELHAGWEEQRLVELKRQAEEHREQAQPLVDEHYELTKDWVMPSAKQARKSGYVEAFNALRGRAPQGQPRLENPVADEQALVIVGAIHRLQQALDLKAPSPSKWLRDLLQQEKALQARYEAIIPNDERNSDMLYATRMTQYIYDNWGDLKPLFESSLPPEKVRAMPDFLARALGIKAEAPLSPAERILRALGETGLAKRVQLLDLKPLTTGDSHEATSAQKRQNVSETKREVASQLDVDPDQIREERLKCFLDICQDIGPDVKVFIVNHTDIGKDTTRLAFKNYLVAVFSYEEGREAIYAENILAGDRASYFYVDTPDWPWRMVLALQKADVQRLGGIRVIHPPSDGLDGDQQHATRLRRIIFGS